MTTISINWIIKQLLVKKTEGELTDVVVTANWSCRGSNGTCSAVLTGCTDFAPPTGSFTPYEDLTEQQVLDWCYENGVDQSAIEANVTQQINDQINPPVVTLPLPWVPVPPPEIVPPLIEQAVPVLVAPIETVTDAPAA